MSKPLVSVIIPSFNYAHYIADTIESVLAQSHDNLEILIIDDGSTDETRTEVAKYGERVKYHFQENQGLSAARNKGITLATGKYLQFLDSDDLLHEQAIALRVQLLESNAGSAYTCCQNRIFLEQKSRLSNFWHNLWFGWKLPNQKDVVATMCYANIAPPHAFLLRAEAIEKPQLRFDTSLKACEDYDFWFALMLNHGEPLIEPNGLVYYRKHRASMSANLSNQLVHDALMSDRVQTAISDSALPEENRYCEYRIANLTAALKTLQHLTTYDSSAAERAGGAALRMLKELDYTCPKFSAAPGLYTSEVRIISHKLGHNPAIGERWNLTTLDRVSNTGCCMSVKYLLHQWKTKQRAPHLARIFLMDIQYFYLRTLKTLRSSH